MQPAAGYLPPSRNAAETHRKASAKNTAVARQKARKQAFFCGACAGVSPALRLDGGRAPAPIPAFFRHRNNAFNVRQERKMQVVHYVAGA